MFRITKLRLVFFAVAVLLSILAVAYLILSTRTFYPDLVFSRVQDAFSKSGGYVLSADLLHGNPITGVNAIGVNIFHKGESIAEASRAEMKLSFRSLLAGKPKLALLSFSELNANYEKVIEHLPEKKEEETSTAPALERLALENATIRTPWGTALVVRGLVGIDASRYTLNFRGAFRDKLFSSRGSYAATSGDQPQLRMNLEWAGQKAEAEARFTPELSAECRFENADTVILSELLPFLKTADISGVYSGEVRLTRKEKLIAHGRLKSSSGRVWRLPFEAMQMDLSYIGNHVQLSDVRAKLFGGEASGDVGITMSSLTPPQLAIRFKARKLDTEKMSGEFPFLEKFPAVIDFASCDIAGPASKLVGPAYLSVPLLHVGDIEFSAGSARAHLNGGEPLGVSFSGKWMDSSVKGSGEVELSAPNQIVLDVSAAPLVLSSVAKQFPELGKQELAGEGTASARIEGPADALTYSVSILFPKLTLKKTYAFSDVSAELGYAKSGLSLKKARALWSGAEITAEGAMRTDPSSSADQTLDFKGNFSKLGLDALGDLVSAIKENDIKGLVSGRWALSGDTKRPIADFGLTIPSLQVGKYATLSDVRSEGSYQPGSLRISKVDMKLGRGSIRGEGRVGLPEGSAPLSYDLTGDFKNIDPKDIQAVREAVSASGDVSGSLNGDLRIWNEKDGKPQVRVTFDKSLMRAARAEVFDISGGVELEGDDLKISKAVGCFYQGRVSLDGRIKNVLAPKSKKQEESLPMDLRVHVTSVDIGRISRIFAPDAHGYQGLLVASGDIRGTPENPRFSGGGNLLGVRAFGLLLPRVHFADVTANKNEIRLPKVNALVGRGRIEASGSITKEKEHWSGAVKANGRSVDIQSVTFSLDDAMRKSITGILNFDFNGNGSISSFEGKGTVYVPNLNAMGFKLTKVCAPFMITDGFIMVEDSSAKAYGGDVMMQMAKDLKVSRWGGRIEVKSADLGPILPDVMPDVGGSVTGKANFKMNIGGDSRRTSMQDGGGSLEVTDGEILGFEGAAAVSKMIGGRPLRFKSLLASFNIDGKTLYLLPGSRVAAPKADPIFKYIMIDGSIGMDKAVALSCVGNVNIRALNIFAGAIQGLMTAAIDNKETLLQDFLGGAITGLSRNEFRDVSLQVKGSPGSIHFQNVVVSRPQKVDLMPEGLSDPDNSKEKDPEKIRINLEFPVGPGSDSGHQNGGAVGQVGGQVLEQAIKGILSF